MIGHKLGEFSPTKKFVKHGGRMQRELEKGAVPAAPAAGAKK
jgi:small subunit ribosomal protein S19